MKRHAAELLTRDPERFFHHDRVFLNNPVVMQGMGLAPLVVLATSGQNALMLAVAVALLLTPSRMLACLLSRLFPLREEHPANAELEKKLLPRSILYSGSAAVVYLAAYPILNRLFGVSLLVLGIYLPMLVVEPLLTYRFGRVQETMKKAVSKGIRITARLRPAAAFAGLCARVAERRHGVRPCAEPSRPAHGQYAGRRLHRAGRAVCRLAHAGREVQKLSDIGGPRPHGGLPPERGGA